MTRRVSPSNLTMLMLEREQPDVDCPWVRSTIVASKRSDTMTSKGRYVILVLCCSAFLVNLIVSRRLYRLLDRKRESWRQYLYVFNLTLTDCASAFLIGVTTFLAMLVPNNSTIHTIAVSLYLLPLIAPTVHYTGIALLQFAAMRHPIKYRLNYTRKRCLLMMYAQWGIIFLFFFILEGRGNVAQAKTNYLSAGIVALIVQSAIFCFVSVCLAISYSCFIIMLIKRRRGDLPATRRACRTQFIIGMTINLTVLCIGYLINVTAHAVKWPLYYNYLQKSLRVQTMYDASRRDDESLKQLFELVCDLNHAMYPFINVKLAQDIVSEILLLRMIFDPIVHLRVEPRLRCCCVSNTEALQRTTALDRSYTNDFLSNAQVRIRVFEAARSPSGFQSRSNSKQATSRELTPLNGFHPASDETFL